MTDGAWAARAARLATVAALCVAVVYLPQPLIPVLAADLRIDEVGAGWIATAIPAGYAVGTLVLIPLTDRIPLHRLVVSLLVSAAILLAAASLLPSVVPLIICAALIGATATVAQMLVPEVLRQAPPSAVGRATGMMTGAFAIGIFSGRIISAFIGDVWGWRAAFVAFAVLLVAAVPIASASVSRDEPAKTSYTELLHGLWKLVVSNATVRRMAVVQALLFACFQLAWTASIFLFTDAPHGWTVAEAGLAGVAGVIGGILTFFTSRTVDRWGVARAVPVAIGLIFACGVLLWAHEFALVALAALLILTVAAQTAQVGTQSATLGAVDPTNRGRANTVFVFVLFLGGSSGVAVATPVMSGLGAPAVAIIVTALALIAYVTFTVRAASRSRRA